MAVSNVTTNSTANEIHISGLTMEWVVAVFVLYIVTTLFCIVGNVLVIIVFARGRRSRTDLRPFLINLAIADLIMAIFCMPFTFPDAIFKHWYFSLPMCPIVIFMQNLSVSASVFINVAIGIDRFIVVNYPLYSKASQARTKYTIATTWILSLAIASIVVPIASAEKEEGSNRVKCRETWPSLASVKIYSLVLFFAVYVIPLGVLVAMYSCIGFVLWKRTAPGNRDHMRDLMQLRSKIKVIKMLIIVVLMFGLCWLPLHVFSLLVNFDPSLLAYKNKEDERFYLIIYLCVHWLAMSNSFANPIIYAFTNESFRCDLKSLAITCFPCCVCLRRNTPSRVNSFAGETTAILRSRAMSRAFSVTSTTSSKSTSGSLHSNGSITSLQPLENSKVFRNCAVGLRKELLRRNSSKIMEKTNRIVFV